MSTVMAVVSLMTALASGAATITTASYSFELDNMFYYGRFGDYSSVNVSLVSDQGIDFWITGKFKLTQKVSHTLNRSLCTECFYVFDKMKMSKILIFGWSKRPFPLQRCS